MNCDTCGKRIAKQRLAVLPDTTTCVRCSREQPYVAGIIAEPEEETPTRVIPLRRPVDRHREAA